MKTFFWNYNEQAVAMDTLYHNAACFLVLSGPSLREIDTSLLRQPGIVTVGVNNSAVYFRPHLWVSVDDPANFAISIWRDPLIQKFVMHGKRNKRLWDNTRWRESNYTVMQCPNVIYYKDNEHFKPSEEYLDEPTINWGNHTDRCECGVMRELDENQKKRKECAVCGGKQFGARSVMLAAIKIIYVLGFRKVFIIGADFKMNDTNTYAFEQERSQHSIKSNSDTYSRLNDRFSKLRPFFESRKFYCFNATPDSGFHSFPKIAYNDAIEMALDGFPDIKNERVFGMYERKACDKHVEDNRLKVIELENQIKKVNGSDVQIAKRLRRKLQNKQDKLRVALEERERLLVWKA